MLLFISGVLTTLVALWLLGKYLVAKKAKEPKTATCIHCNLTLPVENLTKSDHWRDCPTHPARLAYEKCVQERDGWQQKWLADRGEVKRLRDRVKILQPFQDAYHEAMGADELVRQSLRAEKAEAALALAKQQLAQFAKETA